MAVTCTETELDSLEQLSVTQLVEKISAFLSQLAEKNASSEKPVPLAGESPRPCATVLHVRSVDCDLKSRLRMSIVYMRDVMDVTCGVV